MIRSHRKIHKFAWLFLTPVLLVLILMMSNPGRDLYPGNDEPPRQSAKGPIP
ncbi:MAG: hypothetical protein OXN16_15475 [Gammaproteobacteria bacterium]|nr:hypothetical protein [Gammaproteobacteria bacterium]MDE0282450.1 hypothetical protein [Gammaproteobacteria bacterium]MDE0714950.1 hypothetical protein [Gammaproteobacteria bacterium]